MAPTFKGFDLKCQELKGRWRVVVLYLDEVSITFRAKTILVDATDQPTTVLFETGLYSASHVVLPVTVHIM